MRGGLEAKSAELCFHWQLSGMGVMIITGLLTGNRGGCFGSWVFGFTVIGKMQSSGGKSLSQLLQTGEGPHLGGTGFTLWMLSAKVSTIKTILALALSGAAGSSPVTPGGQ